jgi:hypothetical protein
MAQHSESQCQNFLASMVGIVDAAPTPPSSAFYVSALFANTSCDRFVDLSKSRKVYEDRIGKDGVLRLLTEKESLEDVKQTFHAYMGQAPEDKKLFVAGLSWYVLHLTFIHFTYLFTC